MPISLFLRRQLIALPLGLFKMTCKQLPAVPPQFAALALAAVSLITFGNMQVEAAKRLTRKVPKVEIHLTGPDTVSPSASLESQSLRARLTNRSAEPLVFFVRNGYLMNANWSWTVTDDKGTPMGMEFVEHFYCGTIPYDPNWAQLHDRDVFVLGPGESHDFPTPGGPSDDYVFPSAGVYHLSVSLTYVPPNASQYFESHGRRRSANGYEHWDLSDLSLSNLEALQNSLSVQATSDIRNLTLPSGRHPEGGKGLATLMIR